MFTKVLIMACVALAVFAMLATTVVEAGKTDKFQNGLLLGYILASGADTEGMSSG